MPRLSTRLVRYSYRANPLLPLLLRSCRDLESARNELRWLENHVQSNRDHPLRRRTNGRNHNARLRSLCIERGRGKPLQYILGTQPFGDLEIICRPGVLIPRLETEAYTTHLTQLIINDLTTGGYGRIGIHRSEAEQLRILDYCTGSGCIALQLHARLSPYFPRLDVLGIDASRKAVSLAFQNLRSNVHNEHLRPYADQQIQFRQADLFASDAVPQGRWDILIANPPYVSPRGFDRNTSTSVRKYEPRIALVPSENNTGIVYSGDASVDNHKVGDAFYPRLLELSRQVKAKLVITEVADMEQAHRVLSMALRHDDLAQCEVWRDWPDQAAQEAELLQVQGVNIRVVGQGNGRAIVIKTRYSEPRE